MVTASFSWAFVSSSGLVNSVGSSEKTKRTCEKRWDYKPYATEETLEWKPQSSNFLKKELLFSITISLTCNHLFGQLSTLLLFLSIDKILRVCVI